MIDLLKMILEGLAADGNPFDHWINDGILSKLK
jgi:hypothetical protein